MGKYGAERQKIVEENVRLISQIRSHSVEVAALNQQADGVTRLMQMLKAENAKMRTSRLHSNMFHLREQLTFFSTTTD